MSLSLKLPLIPRSVLWNVAALRWTVSGSSIRPCPDDANLGRYDPKAPASPQFRNPVHCVERTHDHGVHSIAADSAGKLHTSEACEGKRVQRFVNKGVGKVVAGAQGVVWPKAN